MAGTFIEELFSPIPSFFVLVPAGAAAQAQGLAPWYLLIFVVLSAIGRIAGGSILYWLADTFEDKLLGHGRRFFGISHREIERFGQRVGRGRRRDWLLLLLMNAVPIFPVAALSLACGFVKVRFVMFIICTFFGTMLNAAIYLTIGYGGLTILKTVRSVELVLQIVAGTVALAALIWLLHKKRKTHQDIPTP